MIESSIGIIGMARRLPNNIRTNNDPIFDWIHKHHPDGEGLFTGYDKRHVLAAGETVLDILTPAARMAIDDADLETRQIDIVIGCISPNTYFVPADLFALTRELKLPETTLTVPLANDFNNFNVGVVLADAMIRAGRARNILVAIGGGWTRAVAYRTPQAVSAADGAAAAAVSAADGAAAAVVGVAPPGRQPRWRLVDTEVIAQEQNFGDMFLIGDRRQAPPAPGVGNDSDPDPQAQNWTGPYYHITASGLKHFGTFGGEMALLAVRRVLQRQGIAAADVTLTGHQASQTLLDIWQQTLKPRATFFTLAEFGNMTVANIPVNLCLLQDTVRTPWVVALGLAGDMHAHAMLLRTSER
jgi:3-oxoacyl-[acyl-carrier-protein] synthase-3